jgi:hypothetical protein
MTDYAQKEDRISRIGIGNYECVDVIIIKILKYFL